MEIRNIKISKQTQNNINSKYDSKLINGTMLPTWAGVIKWVDEHGGSGEITPEALLENMEGSDFISVDLNATGDKVLVEFDFTDIDSFKQQLELDEYVKSIDIDHDSGSYFYYFKWIDQDDQEHEFEMDLREFAASDDRSQTVGVRKIKLYGDIGTDWSEITYDSWNNIHATKLDYLAGGGTDNTRQSVYALIPNGSKLIYNTKFTAAESPNGNSSASFDIFIHKTSNNYGKVIAYACGNGAPYIFDVAGGTIGNWYQLATVNDSGWINATAHIKYRKYNNVVYITANNTSYTELTSFELPTGYRPSTIISFPMWSWTNLDNNQYYARLSTNGKIDVGGAMPTGTTNCGFSLSFPI